MLSAKLLLKGQTNFLRMLWKFNSVYNPARQLADHHKPVKDQMTLPTVYTDPKKIPADKLYILQPAALDTLAQANKKLTEEIETAATLSTPAAPATG